MKRQDRVFLMDGDALIIPQKRFDVDIRSDQGTPPLGLGGWGPMPMQRALK